MAKVLPLKVYRPYRPGSGTEGACFQEKWCCNCARDKAMSEGKDFFECAPEEVCQIIADTYAYSVDDPKYPKEWVYGENGPMCSAFVEVGRRVPERCKYTIDWIDQLNATDSRAPHG